MSGLAGARVLNDSYRGDFYGMDRNDLVEFIFEKKRELGNELCILEHNFQLDDLLQFADVIGDTSSLLNKTRSTEAEYLVYCGARFFTEAGAILCPEKKIVQANMEADCPLTYEVDEAATEKVFDLIKENINAELVPVIYFTANYKLKSFCGRNNGASCTASGAHTIIKHYLDHNKAIFFTPMSNIAFNVVKDFNIPAEDVLVVNKDTKVEDLNGEKKIYIWDIGCYVHSDFSVQDVLKIRDQYEGIKIISHLECLPDTIAASDFGAFTDGVWDIVKKMPEQESWGLATVNNFAYRLARAYPEKTIVPVRSDLSCKDMMVTDLPHLAECLESVIAYRKGEGELKTQLIIPEKDRKFAMKSINTMYEILEQG